MREIFKYGSVGRALRKQCLYPETSREKLCRFSLNSLLDRNNSGPLVIRKVRCSLIFNQETPNY